MSALNKYHARGYTFTRQDILAPAGSDAMVRVAERAWDDRQSLQMPFDDKYPITQFPRLRWTTATRIYDDRGFYDLGPTVMFDQEGVEVTLMNNLFFKRVTMAPESF